jgi:hypothetical protein
VQGGGGLTVLLLGGFMFIMFRRDALHNLDKQDGTGTSGTGKKVNG